jgi:hypothetical protein
VVVAPAPERPIDGGMPIETLIVHKMEEKLRELDRRSGVTEWRLHDFRRSIVSICAELALTSRSWDSLLNHASSATRGRSSAPISRDR